MSQSIQIETLEAVHALEVTVTIPMWRIPKALGEHFPRIKAHIEASDASQAGPPYARYQSIRWGRVRKQGVISMLWMMLTGKLTMQIGMPASTAMTGHGDIAPAVWPAGQYVTTIHMGAYHKVGESYRNVANWALAEGVELDNHAVESYQNDPSEVEVADQETRIIIPIVSADR